MLGKYCISCLGGPDDILGSLALRIELVVKQRVAGLNAADDVKLNILEAERRVTELMKTKGLIE